MGAVHSQLMCPSGERIQQDLRLAVGAGDYLIAGFGRFAVLLVHHLSRTVCRIGGKRQADCALAWSLGNAVEYCPVAFLHRA